MLPTQDTICALSTAPGQGAIALIRLSGKDALNIVQPVFSKHIREASSHTAHFGYITQANGEVLDEVLITVLWAGKSFTGEETVEIACHGSNYIQQEILKLLLKQGARMAEPGEFTQRAFLNGRMDLSQAEAVADLIASESAQAHRLAMNQMKGHFSNELAQVREKLIHFASLVELELDFAEEDVEFADRTELRSLVAEVCLYLQQLIRSFELGNAIKNGVPVALIGAPNTGKSTLLNRLLGEDRAIVSPIAGTTRDTVEETLNLGGILFRLIDTAGIREDAAEEIEAIGIQRSLQKLESASIVLLLCDLTKESPHQQEVINWAVELNHKYPEKHLAILLNKCDVSDSLPLAPMGIQTLPISAKNGTGIKDLERWLEDEIMRGQNSQSTVVSSARHVEALQQALDSLERATYGLNSQMTGDFIAMDIRQAMYHLGRITGTISTDDLLGNIFSKFCIGK